MTHKHWWNSIFQKAQILLTPPKPLQPGLYTYPVALPGGQRRIHLRVEKDGRGLLFIDVTDVIHLNTTATEMAKLALDNIPKDQAVTYLLHRYENVSREEITEALEQIYNMVERLRTNTEGCPTCTIADELIFKPIFSTPVNAPYKADLALTYACNNACPHCYNEPERFEMTPLPKEKWFQVFDKLVTIGIPHIILTGGEPTLYPDLPALITYGDQQGLILGMNSNGRALSHRPLMEKIADAGLNHLQVTLESNQAKVHNTMVGAPAFDQTVQGIKNALSCGVHTITNTTITRQNSGHLLETVTFLHDLGLGTFAMNGMIYAGGGVNDSDAIPAEEMAGLLAGVRDKAQALNMRFLWYTVTDYCRFSPVALGLAPKRCNAAEYSICIEPNGDVLPCQSYYVSAGNILTDPWEKIWNSDLFLSFRNREDDPLAAGLPEECWDCPDLSMCGGGCRLEHEAQAGVRAAERGCARARVTLRSSGRP